MRIIIVTILFTMLLAPSINAQPRTLHDLGLKAIKLTHDLQYDQANKIFDEMIRMEPENAMGYFFKSACYYWMEDYSLSSGKGYRDISFKAADMAKAMLDKNEDDIDAMFYLGCIYGKLGLHYGEYGHFIKAIWYGSKGIKCLKKVIEKDPDYYDAYVGLGIYDYYLSVLPKVVKALSFLIGKYGDRGKGLDEMKLTASKGTYAKAEAKIALADVYFTYERNYETAIPLYVELTTDFPHNHYYLLHLGICYQRAKKYDEAVTAFEEAVKQKPNDISYRLNIGWVYVDSLQFDKAFNTFEKMIEDDPTFSNSYYQMGRTSIISKQRLGSADKYLLKYLDMKQFKNSPSEAWAHYRLGQVYEMTGKIEQAKEQYQKALKLDRKHKEAKEALERLK